MVEQLPFNAILDLDTSNDVFAPGFHKNARNVVFKGLPGRYRAENILGTRKIANHLPDGNNQCIGAHYDELKQRVFFFNWNSNGRNGIYVYYRLKGYIKPLLVSFTHSASDVFNFDPAFPIASINILYTTETDGDILHWVARNNRPCKLNIRDAINNFYNNAWTADFLTVARRTPLLPPLYVYQNDVTVNMNNLRKKLYEFRYRYIYKDFTKSTWSAYSKLFSPANPDDIAEDVNEQRNNRIDVTLDTGDADVVKIELAARTVIETTFSDDFGVIVLDKIELNLRDNAPYVYKFYNDTATTSLDVQESNLLFDYVPKRANSQELLNGNILAYGGITEGLNFSETLNVEVAVAMMEYVSLGSGSVVITMGYQNTNQLADGSWESHLFFKFRGTPTAGDTYTLVVSKGSTNFPFSYTVQDGDNMTMVLAALAAAAPVSSIGGGGASYTFGVSSIGDGVFYDVSPTAIGPDPDYIPLGGGDIPLSGSSSTVYSSANNSPIDGVSNSIYKHLSRYGFGIVYFDEFGVTNGVVTTTAMSIITPEINTTGLTSPLIPQITFSINSQPPVWAYSFSFVRTNNLSTQTQLMTISASTQHDPNYGYIEITNQQTNQNNYPSYDFKDGDRIKIVGKFGDPASVVDLPIVSIKTDPTISTAQTNPVKGIFVLVPYTSVLSNLGVAGNEHLYIEIYTPAINTTKTQQLYYEFGESYKVLNPGTVNRAHAGQFQDQVYGSRPAIFKFIRGDFYLRQRSVPFNANLSGAGNIWIVDQSVSDKYLSKINGNGRAFVIDPYAKETYYPTLIRFSLAYQQDTNINQTNRFYPNNFDEYDRQKGDIQRLKLHGDILRVFQSRGVLSVGILKQMLTNADGTNNLIQSDKILNRLNYLQGDFGIGNQYCSLASSAGADYFSDPVRGYQVRVAGDGMNPINKLYKAQYYLSPVLNRYLHDYLYSTGGYAKILGVYDFLNEEFISVFQGGIEPIPTSDLGFTKSISGGRVIVTFFGTPVAGYTVTITMVAKNGQNQAFAYTIQEGDGLPEVIAGLGALITASSIFHWNTLGIGASSMNIGTNNPLNSSTGTVSIVFTAERKVIPFDTIGFNEPRNGYSSFYDYNPEWIICAETTLVSWKDGQLYAHDNDNKARGTFYGVSYPCVIDLVCNAVPNAKKEFQHVGYHSETAWKSLFILTALKQNSTLFETDYTDEEGMFYAAFLREINSDGGRLDGKFLKGVWLQLRLQNDATDYQYLTGAFVGYAQSEKNF